MFSCGGKTPNLLSELGLPVTFAYGSWLRGNIRKHFFYFLQEQYPDRVDNYRMLSKTGGASKGYKQGLYLMVHGLRDKYQLASSYMKPMRGRLP